MVLKTTKGISDLSQVASVQSTGFLKIILLTAFHRSDTGPYPLLPGARQGVRVTSSIFQDAGDTHEAERQQLDSYIQSIIPRHFQAGV